MNSRPQGVTSPPFAPHLSGFAVNTSSLCALSLGLWDTLRCCHVDVLTSCIFHWKVRHASLFNCVGSCGCGSRAGSTGGTRVVTLCEGLFIIDVWEGVCVSVCACMRWSVCVCVCVCVCVS